VLEGHAKAAGLTISEWVRHTLMARSDDQGKEMAAEVVLAELMALRTLFLNLSFRAGKEPLTEAEMNKLIERADATKLERARQRLQISNGSTREEGAKGSAKPSDEV